MKIAITYNTPDGETLMPRGSASHEWIPLTQIERVTAALQRAGHQVQSIEADMHVIERLSEYFEPERKQEWPGLVFNLAYGTQGVARYCHMPSILEMMGLPYLGSDPLGHALAYDKLTAKRLFSSLHLMTPPYDVYESSPKEDLAESSTGQGLFPDAHHRVVVKPVAEAVSEGLELVEDSQHLYEAVERNLESFGGPVLAEEYIAGREINVALIGNDPVETLPPVEVIVKGSPLFDTETKHGQGAAFRLECPARLPEATRQRARDLAVQAFSVLRCRDWARVDFRLDESGEPYILEVNTIPGFTPSSSYFAASKAAGFKSMDELVLRLVDVALQRYQATEERTSATKSERA